jgi:hypothetical protein
MTKKILGIGALALTALLVIGALVALVLPQHVFAAHGTPQRVTQRPAVSNPTRSAPLLSPVPAGDLSASEVDALTMALNDEYHAWSAYDQIIADLGAVRPFTSIQRAEENHIAALVALFDRYGLDVPANEWPGSVPSFDTLAEACEAGVQAEIDNAALYDQLLNMVDNPDIIQVFTNLQQASLTKHLPAFERCAP